MQQTGHMKLDEVDSDGIPDIQREMSDTIQKLLDAYQEITGVNIDSLQVPFELSVKTIEIGDGVDTFVKEVERFS